MKIRYIVLFFLCLCMTAGCSSKRELNEIGIVLGLGIDRDKDGYALSAQIVNASSMSLQQGGGGNYASVSKYVTHGKTLFETVRRFTKQTPRKLYFSHLRMIIIGEKLAKEERLGKFLELFLRDPELRKDVYMIVAKGTTAEDVLAIETPMEKVPVNKIYYSLETAEKFWGSTTIVPLNDLAVAIRRSGQSPILPSVSIIGSQKKGESPENVARISPYTFLRLGEVGIFKQDKLVGWLNEEETKGFNYIQQRMNSTVGHIHCPKGGIINIELIDAKTKIKTHIKSGKPSVDVYVDIKANVGEVSCNIDISNTENVKVIQKKFNERVQDLMKQAVVKAKEHRADIFGFGNLFYHHHPTEWEKIKKTWHDEGFIHTDVRYHVNTHIEHTGVTIDNPLKGKQ